MYRPGVVRSQPSSFFPFPYPAPSSYCHLTSWSGAPRLTPPQEDAARIVSWSKYPPLGSRGYGPMFCPHTFNVAEATYPTQADESLLVIVQIESRKAIENVEAIAAVPGLDVLFIGT